MADKKIIPVKEIIVPIHLIEEFTLNKRIVAPDIKSGTKRYDRAIFAEVVKQVLSNPAFYNKYSNLGAE